MVKETGEHQDGGNAQDEAYGKRVEVYAISGWTILPAHTWKFSGPHTYEILWRLHHKGVTDHQLNFPSFQEDGAKNSKLPIMAWPFWWPALIQESNQSHLNGTKDTPITQEITGVSWTLCQERWSKTKIRTRDDPSVIT